MYITYIDQEELVKTEEKMKKNKAKVDEEERNKKEIEKQKARALKTEQEIGIATASASTVLKRDDPNEKINFSFGAKKEVKSVNQKPKNIFDDDSDDEEKSSESNVTGKKRKFEEVETKKEEPEEEPPTKKKRTVLPYWLHKDIVVKVIVKDLAGGKYYKKKGKRIYLQLNVRKLTNKENCRSCYSSC